MKPLPPNTATMPLPSLIMTMALAMAVAAHKRPRPGGRRFRRLFPSVDKAFAGLHMARPTTRNRSKCPGGGIGRRTSFRCWRSQGRGGSSPLLGTIRAYRMRGRIRARESGAQADVGQSRPSVGRASMTIRGRAAPAGRDRPRLLEREIILDRDYSDDPCDQIQRDPELHEVHVIVGADLVDDRVGLVAERGCE
jgi:hypothetical protein